MTILAIDHNATHWRFRVLLDTGKHWIQVAKATQPDQARAVLDGVRCLRRFLKGMP